MATFLASVCLNDDERAIKINTNASPATRLDPVLLNNLAFSHARLGDLKAATDALNLVNLAECNERNVFMLAATRGLILFRAGITEEGRNSYRKSVQGFEKLADLRSAAIATFYWATEEKRGRSSEALALIADAKKRVKNAGVFELEDSTNKL